MSFFEIIFDFTLFITEKLNFFSALFSFQGTGQKALLFDSA